jgi:helicase MOV-10
MIVMAGDDKQLGPRVISKSSKHHGLHVSVMERLVECCGVYKKRTDPNFSMTLTKNYRNHPAILNLLSTLFYNNKLESCAGLFLIFFEISCLSSFKLQIHKISHKQMT